MGYGRGIRIVQSALVFLAIDDELINRIKLAFGEIRALGNSSKLQDISQKNQKKIDKFDADFTALQELPYQPRELEILSEKLVEICVDIVEDNAEARLKR